MDFRFGSAIKNYLAGKNLLDDCDIVAVAGAAQNVASPRVASDRDTILRQIEISQRLHAITSVVLINHTDCGAYGGTAAFATPEDEQTTHAGDLATAAQIISERFLGLSVEKTLAHIDPSGQITFQTIP
jgi:carbonic anhydrase